MKETSRDKDKKPYVNNYLGRALKFYSSVRMDVRRIEAIKQGGEVIGNRTRVKVVKNKIAPPFKEAEFDILFGKGIDSIGEIVDISVNNEFIVKSGAWFSLPDGTKIGQGRANAIEYVKQHPELEESLRKAINEKYFNKEDKTEEEVEEAPKKKGKKTSDED